ncbi:MAG: Stk1 family PASTA domain-containing Ser/Thr kinase [Oscillospiraceae bacterium]|nr:Stk1 family PASTA domain-containing Ser/Thr kinase [Oscillospiraceae bacterium]
MDQYIGKMLDNRYEILEVIGTGGMAVVYKAMCHRLNRLVAIKILKSDLAKNADFRRRFHVEAEAVAKLSHPNIVSVYDVSHDGDAQFIVMELIDGITLKQYMERRGQLNWRESLHFITQIMRGLSHAHSRGIIHRDIKPHNIMILRDGSVKVADFGIACLAAAGENTLTQEALGSVHYISPEQAKGGHIDARSDIYSAGVVLYEMLTNRLPFEGDTAVSIAIQHISSIPLSPREIKPDVPEALELITMKAMAPDVSKRYVSADAMLADLEEFRKNPSVNFDYVLSDFALDETDEPTQHLSAQEVEEVKQLSKPQPKKLAEPYYYDDDDDADGNKKRKRTVIGLIIGAVAVVVVIWAIVLSSFGGGTQEYEVPNLLGMTMEQVEQAQKNGSIDAVFSIVDGGADFSSEYDKDEIMQQDPEAGKIKKGETIEISVVISAGEQTADMPDIVNYESRSAQMLLDNMKLNLSVQTVESSSDTITSGYIISTQPEAGESLADGDTVILYVSTGPEIKKITVPSYLGLNIDDVKAQMTGLTFGGYTEVSDDSAAGTILTQSLDVKSEVDEGTEITFTVSSGKAQTSVTKSWALPAGDGTVHVVIKLDDNSVFDSTVNKSVGTVSRTFTGSGTSIVDVYFDDVLTYSEEIVFD